MTDDDRRPDSTPGSTPGDQGPFSGGSQGSPSDRDEHTQPYAPVPPSAAQSAPQPAADPWAAPQDTGRYEQPPIWQGYAAPVAEQPRPSRHGRSKLVAGVLVAALVVGGAAGVGGAAAYDAFTGGSSSTSPAASTPERFEATKTSVVEDGTVESVASAVLPSVVKVNVVGSEGAGSGSGIILSKDGEILTNDHVVSGAGSDGSISVSFNDGTTAPAQVVGTDPLTDIAVIKAQGVDDLTPASIGKSGELKVGQAVVAIGSPFGLDATVTSGIVSALNRPVSISTSEEQNPFGGQEQQSSQSTTYPAIQTDAAINPGNSGGPLVDMSGRVVGINSSIRSASSGSGQAGSIGLGFAIPLDEVLPIVNQIVGGETPTHARLGVSVGQPQATVDDPNPGALVSSVEQGGAGAAAGLQQGDVITKVDDQVVDGPDALVATIRGHRPGDEVTLTYTRDGQTRTTSADLGSDAGQPTS